VLLKFAGNHDVTRLASRLADQRHLVHALVILLTAGGTRPSTTATSRRSRESRRTGPGRRRNPACLPGHPAGLPADGWPAYRLHQDLIGLRRRHPWLHQARTEPVQVANEQLVYRSRPVRSGCWWR
jgi:cyclomaltodextrinase / maltogenic alpha-amylase / neopullulanase